jgi:hypothetical protein
MSLLVEAGTRLGRDHAQQYERFRLHWTEHVEKTRAQILRCVQRVAKPESVTILGAGSAYNIPLAELAASFAAVRLVDIDHDGLRAAVGGLPAAARDRVEIHVADVTGGAAAVLLEVGLEAIADSADPRSALARLTQLFASPAADAQPPPEQVLAWRASCVISSCVASQLALFPHRVLAQAFKQKFGADPGASLFLEGGLDRVREQWVRRHGELLAALVCAGGAVYWADTVAETPCLGAFGPAPLAAVVELTADFLRKQKSADLRTWLTDAGKADLASRFAQVAAFPLASEAAGRSEQGDRLLQSFKAELDATARGIVTWAIITAVGENLIAPRRELELLDRIRRAAERLRPDARQPILQTHFAELFPRSLVTDGELESWLWINDPRAAATLEGGAYHVEAQILRPRE